MIIGDYEIVQVVTWGDIAYAIKTKKGFLHPDRQGNSYSIKKIPYTFASLKSAMNKLLSYQNNWK